MERKLNTRGTLLLLAVASTLCAYGTVNTLHLRDNPQLFNADVVEKIKTAHEDPKSVHLPDADLIKQIIRKGIQLLPKK
jgi:hypothetical protein